MNDNFKCIYKILKALEKAMDCPDFDINQISHEKLEISKERWCRYIEMMADSDFIKGISIYEDILGETNIQNEGIKITLKGLEFLSENSIMQRFYQIAKGVNEFIPGT